MNYHKKLVSCDLPSDDEDDVALVKITHNFADKILSDTNKSWLLKILEIALFSIKHGFGNCQEKAFFGFAAILLAMQKTDILITSLRLPTFDNHFIVIVNERFLMDPWLNLAFPLNPENPDIALDYVFEGFGNLVDYFSIDVLHNHCFSHEVTEKSMSQQDLASERDLATGIQFLKRQEEYFDLPDLKTKRSKNGKRPPSSDLNIELEHVTRPNVSDSNPEEIASTPRKKAKLHADGDNSIHILSDALRQSGQSFFSTVSPVEPSVNPKHTELTSGLESHYFTSAWIRNL